MAFKIAVSGLRGAATDLDVTGNNIANAGTTAFKKSRTQFSDVYAVSNLGTGSDAIGHGVQVSAVTQQFTQGNLSFTDNNLDLAINGEGFFVLDEGESEVTREPARSGSIETARRQSHRPTVVAFGAVNGAVTGALAPLQLTTTVLAPQATSNVDVEVTWTPMNPR